MFFCSLKTGMTTEIIGWVHSGLVLTEGVQKKRSFLFFSFLKAISLPGLSECLHFQLPHSPIVVRSCIPAVSITKKGSPLPREEL